MTELKEWRYFKEHCISLTHWQFYIFAFRFYKFDPSFYGCFCKNKKAWSFYWLNIRIKENLNELPNGRAINPWFSLMFPLQVQ
jgi:hypothetical protein